MNTVKKFNMIISTLLVTLFFLTAVIPVYAEDEKQNNVFSLEDIQDLAVKNSRLLEKLDYTTDQATKAKYIYNNSHRKVQSQKVGQFEMGTISNAQIDHRLFEINKEMLEVTDPKQILPLQTELNLLLMQKEVNKKAPIIMSDFMDSQMSLMQGLGVASHDSILKELRSRKERAEDTIEDLERAREDADDQVRQLVTLLTFETIKLEKNINLLEKIADLYSRLATVERLKVEQGLANSAQAQEIGIKASEYSKQCKFAKENLQILKGKLNDLMGRGIDEPLNIKEFRVPGPHMAVPRYENIIDEVMENTYEFQRLDREIDNLEDDLKDVDGSNEKDIKRNEIKKVELDVKDKDLEVRNEIKGILADMEEKVKAYQLANVNLAKVNQEFKWKKMELDSEVISPLMLDGAEIDYLKAEIDRLVASYDYYLTQNELELVKKGIFMPDDYKLAKMQFSKAN